MPEGPPPQVSRRVLGCPAAWSPATQPGTPARRPGLGRSSWWSSPFLQPSQLHLWAVGAPGPRHLHTKDRNIYSLHRAPLRPTWPLAPVLHWAQLGQRRLWNPGAWNRPSRRVLPGSSPHTEPNAGTSGPDCDQRCAGPARATLRSLSSGFVRVCSPPLGHTAAGPGPRFPSAPAPPSLNCDPALYRIPPRPLRALSVPKLPGPAPSPAPRIGGRLGTTESAEPPNRPEQPEVCEASGGECPRPVSGVVALLESLAGPGRVSRC